MNLEEMIVAWKKQDAHIGEQLRIGTLRGLLKIKSNHALRRIKNSLIKELAVISVVIIVFDGLFFLVDIPFTPLRWACFAGFNLIAGSYIIFYQKFIRESRFEYEATLKANLNRIVQSVTRFRYVYKLTNLPITFICFLMFAGAQGILILLPWMIVEFSILRWALLPKLTLRFDDYKADLEYSLKQLEEIRD